MPFDPDQPRDDQGQWTDGGTDDIEEALKNQDAWVSELSDEDKKAFDIYTGIDSYRINSFLRGGEESLQVKHENTISVLDKTLADAPKFTGEVYRALSFQDNLLLEEFDSQTNVGEIFTDNGFMSTSYSGKSSAFSDTNFNVFLTIESRTGVIIDKLSQVRGEKEVIIPRNSEFKVMSKAKDYNRDILHIKLKQL